MANGIKIIGLQRPQNVDHLSAKNDDLIGEIDERVDLQPDTERLEIEALADLAQGLVADQGRDLEEEVHVEPRKGPGLWLTLAGKLVNALNERANTIKRLRGR